MRQLLNAVAVVQTGTLVLGVASLAGTTGSDQAGSAYIFDAGGLAISAIALIFTAAVIAALRRARGNEPA